MSFGVAEAFGYRGDNTYARSFTVADGKYWLHNLADEPLPAAASFPSGAFPGEPEKCAGCPKNKIKVVAVKAKPECCSEQNRNREKSL